MNIISINNSNSRALIIIASSILTTNSSTKGSIWINVK